MTEGLSPGDQGLVHLRPGRLGAVDAADSPTWCSVRCLFSYRREDEMVYEERITIWRTGDLDEAIARAEDEARTYAAESTQALGQAVDYLGLA